ncbi:MAG: sigma-70 family RNA polymerase sigma factor [Planctomycetota bacterium]|nr:sigma-70 family RNA polymerase sigma factor [Planctomycetota bacterium]
MELPVERFREYLCLLARTRLRSGRQPQVEASDVVQQTLLEAYREKDQFRGTTDAELAAWLKQILLRNLADAIRATHRAKRDVRRERSLEAEIDASFSQTENWLAANQSTPSQHAGRVDELLKLAERLSQLPDGQREAVTLHHLQGCSLAEVANHLQRTESAVAGLLHRGLEKLRELMDPS